MNALYNLGMPYTHIVQELVAYPTSVFKQWNCKVGFDAVAWVTRRLVWAGRWSGVADSSV
jgi:hypothetical protein